MRELTTDTTLAKCEFCDEFAWNMQGIKEIYFVELNHFSSNDNITCFVMLMDTSARFKTREIDSLSAQAKQQRVMSMHRRYILPTPLHEDTFQYLKVLTQLLSLERIKY